MKRLITVEEHYNSQAVNEKIRKIYAEHGRDSDMRAMGAAAGEAAPGASDMGAERIAYMDAHGIDAQIISYASGIPATMEPEFSVALCRDVNCRPAD